MREARERLFQFAERRLWTIGLEQKVSSVQFVERELGFIPKF